MQIAERQVSWGITIGYHWRGREIISAVKIVNLSHMEIHRNWQLSATNCDITLCSSSGGRFVAKEQCSVLAINQARLVG